MEEIHCRLNKQIYSSQKKAEYSRKRQYKQRGVNLRVYYCAICEGWHLTKRGAIPDEKPIIPFNLADFTLNDD